MRTREQNCRVRGRKGIIGGENGKKQRGVGRKWDGRRVGG